ncbi:potassium channel family protein [Halalkalicoccus salilacus]|uniref:potassium channel family protein n=1 Tax=Halalkalicoccus sp. GCM10025704 TaxID=3252662 RepID=UPI0036149A0A
MLVVAGPSDVIDEVREEVSGVRSVREHTNVIVAGMGEGGRAAINALSGDVSITTIDLNEDEAVDVVGDSSDPETLAAAGIEDATALIVTVDDDAIALLTIALARSLTDEIEILVRVTSNEKVRTAFSAGADYVLSIQQATARLLAREIYGEDIVSPLSQIRLVRTDAAPFAGQSLKEANEGAETGWVLVGVERDGTLRTEATTQIDGGDKVLVAGTDVMIQEFEEETTRS